MTEEISSEQAEIVHEFINEARELIEDLEPSIIGLDQLIEVSELTDEDIDTLNAIFRLFHSVKGGAGFLQFSNIVETTHTAENLLDGLRSGAVQITHEHVDLLCQCCDFTKEALETVEEQLNDASMADAAQELIARFNQGKPQHEEAPSQQAPQDPAEGTTEPITLSLDESPDETITVETRNNFLQEADALHGEIEADLLTVTKTPDDHAPIENLYRNIHSLKGNCGFMGFGELEKILHTEETLLGTLNKGDTKRTIRVAEMLLEMLDVHKEAFADIAQGGVGAIQGFELYLELLNNLLPEDIQQATELPSSKLGDILVQQGAVEKEQIDTALQIQNKSIGELLVESGTVKQEQVDKALQIQEKLRPTAAKRVAKPPKKQDIRVDLDKLDGLINLIGEIVIAENMVINNPDLVDLELENFNKAGQHMTKIVRELQEMAMIIRMIPISALFRRMIRLVHDLSRKSGKKVDLQISGETTEVDKTVIEKITDPMVHLIRNAMDHGLETIEGRHNAEKNETGIIALSAQHEEGEVHIILKDDGRGLDRKKLIAKGIEQGIVDGDGSHLSDKEAFRLIFHPGFSTAEKVTDISGRGVGMDVVRQNLEAIKGRVDIDSSLGKGTTITLRIPLTLAIIDGMQVRTGNSFYILPILSIKESFRPKKEAITIAPDGEELVRVREKLLPVLRLHTLHEIEPDSTNLEEGILIVLETRDKKGICLFVDELMGQQQTVIKNLSQYINTLGEVAGVSGCTILGNGEVCLILDVGRLEEAMNEKQ